MLHPKRFVGFFSTKWVKKRMILLAAVVCGQKMVGCIHIAYGDELCGVPLGKWDELPGLELGCQLLRMGKGKRPRWLKELSSGSTLRRVTDSLH